MQRGFINRQRDIHTLAKRIKIIGRRINSGFKPSMHQPARHGKVNLPALLPGDMPSQPI